MKQSLVFVISMACVVILNGQPITDNDEINQCTISKSFVMGKTDFGSWTKTIMCKNNGQVSGFRLRVEDPCDCDDTGLNGIQLMCRDGTTTPQIEGHHGKWKPWQACGNNKNHALNSYVDGFNFRSEPLLGKGESDDDTAGNNVKMQCDNGNELDGQGTTWGSWDHKDYQRCPSGSFLCGVQAKIEDYQGSGDDTGLNQIKFVCCKVKVSITKSFVMGKTHFGSWTKTTMCKNSGQVSGFRLRVEDPCGDSCDDTALNGIQLMCKDGTTTPEIEEKLHGKWKPWQSCGNKVGNHGYHSYIDGFNFRSEPLLGKGESDDDTAGNNVKMQCANGNELDGQGTTWGSWDHKGYQRCPSDSFFCGVQAKIEVSHGANFDDTGVNQIKFLCCKVKGMCQLPVNDEKADNQIPVDEMNADADIPETDADIPEADADIPESDADIQEADADIPDADATKALDF